MLLYIVEAKKGCKKKSLNILSLAAYLLNVKHTNHINDFDISIREHDSIGRRGYGEHEGEIGGQSRGEHQVERVQV